MRPLRVSENFVPVSEFKAQASELLRRLGEDGAPLVVTQNGTPAAVLLSPKAFDELTERARFLTAVVEGLTELDEGRGIPHEDVVAELNARFRRKKK